VVRSTTAYEVVLSFVLGVLIGAVAALFLLFFGIGDWSKITIAITGVAFIVLYNLYLGIRLVKDELVEIVRVMGGRGMHVLRYVTLPSLAAPFFAGLKAAGQ
jgi:NitT/TauT family transport system permease protein